MEHPARRRSPTYDYLDFVHGAKVFLNALAGASTCAPYQRRRGEPLDPHLLGADGFGVPVPHRQCGHCVFFEATGKARPRRPRSNGPTDAVEDALRSIETHTLLTRTGPPGIRKVNGRGLVATAFTHPDSRAGDQISIPMWRSRTRVQSLDGQLVGLARLGEQDDGKASLGLT
jgi:hypothetical protein